MILGSGFINFDSTIVCAQKITIGSDVAISHNVIIRDDDAHRIIREGYEQKKDIYIGNHVWIGANATILKGAHLGDGCVVAAGSVVNGHFPSKCLIAGVPGRIIRHDVEWQY